MNAELTLAEQTYYYYYYTLPTRTVVVLYNIVGRRYKKITSRRSYYPRYTRTGDDKYCAGQ